VTCYIILHDRAEMLYSLVELVYGLLNAAAPFVKRTNDFFNDYCLDDAYL